MKCENCNKGISEGGSWWTDGTFCICCKHDIKPIKQNLIISSNLVDFCECVIPHEETSGLCHSCQKSIKLSK